MSDNQNKLSDHVLVPRETADGYKVYPVWVNKDGDINLLGGCTIGKMFARECRVWLAEYDAQRAAAPASPAGEDIRKAVVEEDVRLVLSGALSTLRLVAQHGRIDNSEYRMNLVGEVIGQIEAALHPADQPVGKTCVEALAEALEKSGWFISLCSDGNSNTRHAAEIIAQDISAVLATHPSPEAREAEVAIYTEGVCGDCVAILKDGHPMTFNQILADLNAASSPAQDREELLDKIDGLDSDLRSAVEVAYNHGAHEWVRLNYPKDYERLSKSSPAPLQDGKWPTNDAVQAATESAVQFWRTCKRPDLDDEAKVRGALMKYQMALDASTILAIKSAPNTPTKDPS